MIPGQKQQKYSYADYLTFGEHENYEIIDGVPYAMSPAPSTDHQRISMNLLGEFYTKLYKISRMKIGPCELFHAPFDVRLPREKGDADDKIFDVVQPDILVVCDNSKLDERGCLGAPDLIVEILSPSTALVDLADKRTLYERAGVKEYWIVNPKDRSAMVFSLEGDRYLPPVFYLNGTTITSRAISIDIDYNI